MIDKLIVMSQREHLLSFRVSFNVALLQAKTFVHLKKTPALQASFDFKSDFQQEKFPGTFKKQAPNSWRGFLYIYLLSFPRFWTFCFEWFAFLFLMA